jgi:hypothetical protein
MDAPNDKFWFPAKKYGYGWGPPKSWQGWVVIAMFFVLVGAGALVLLPGEHTLNFLFYVITLCVVLSFVCWLKGEKPRWRSREDAMKRDE